MDRREYWYFRVLCRRRVLWALCTSLTPRAYASDGKLATTRPVMELPSPPPPPGCIGRGEGPIQGAQPMPSHCLSDAKCQPQRHLSPTVTAPKRFGNRLWGPFPSTASLPPPPPNGARWF